MGTEQTPAKEDIARALLLRGNVFVHIDPRKEGVVLPLHLKKQSQVLLQVGLDMPVPIPDLRVDEEGVSGTLSFNRSPFACHVPWHAVFALGGDDGRGMVWPESMPTEVEEEVEREMGRKPPKGLRVLDGGAEIQTAPPEDESGISPEPALEGDEALAAQGGDPVAAPARRRGHLRLVHNAE